MSIPDQDHINKVLLWMSYADEDLDLANYAMKMPGIRSYRLIAFHAQQCAEKYLKAYPMLDEKVTENEAVEAANMASIVRKTIRTALLDEGMNIEEDASQ